VNIGPQVSVDVAAFGTPASLDRRRLFGLAASVSINHPR
jgi:hypothetical protein